MARSAAVDPLEKFRFIVTWSNDGDNEPTALVRAGFHDVSSPKRTTTKGTYRDGVDPDVPQLFAGLSNMEDVTLSRGLLIDDLNNEMYKWMSAVHRPTSGHLAREAVDARASDAASNTYRKDVTITMLDREGNAARKWTLYQAWPQSFTPGSDLNADEDGEKSLESITLAYEDFKEIQPSGTEEKAVSNAVS